jgi:hypothetical protein
VTYKPSPLAYPPIVTGYPAPYPLTRPMGSYMTPAAIYAPQYVPVHGPRHAYGDARLDMLDAMKADPLYAKPDNFIDMAGKGGLMLLSGTIFGGIAATLSFIVTEFALDAVAPKAKRGVTTGKVLDLATTGAFVVPFAVGIGAGTYGAYRAYLDYRGSR